jgi:hypothetical protein
MTAPACLASRGPCLASRGPLNAVGLGVPVHADHLRSVPLRPVYTRIPKLRVVRNVRTQVVDNLVDNVGKPADKPTRPVGNAVVKTPRHVAIHSTVSGRVRSPHSHCAWQPRGLPARMAVIPRIHRPYDDYHFRYERYVNTKAGRPAGQPSQPARPLRRTQRQRPPEVRAPRPVARQPGQLGRSEKERDR